MGRGGRTAPRSCVCSSRVQGSAADSPGREGSRLGGRPSSGLDASETRIRHPGGAAGRQRDIRVRRQDASSTGHVHSVDSMCKCKPEWGKEAGVSGYFTDSVWVGGAGTLLHPRTNSGSVGPPAPGPAPGTSNSGCPSPRDSGSKRRRLQLRAPPVFSLWLCSSSGIPLCSL